MPLIISLLLLGCTDGASDDPSASMLTVDAATSVPAGDASGDAWSGDYQAQIYTDACRGSCAVGLDTLLPVSFCDVGEDDTEYLQISQADGLLEISLNDPISRYAGGVYQDGAMEAGGYATDLGGAIEMTAVLLGDFTADGLTASAASHIWGTVDGEVVDCWGDYTVTAARR